MINRDRLVDNFINLCRVHGESRGESKTATAVEKLIKKIELTVEYEHVEHNFNGDTPNLIVRVNGDIKGPTIMLSSHTDTVITGGEVDPIIDGDYIRSSGNTILGADDKAGITAIIEAIETAKEKDIPHYPLLLVFTAAEEVGLLGARYSKIGKGDADFGVVLDTGGPIGTIVNEAPFHDAYKIKVRGKSSHAGIDPESGINAIKIAAEIISKLPTGRVDEKTTSNIARIRGGVADNIVPELVTINGEIRSTSKERLENLLAEFNSIIDEYESATFISEREYNGYHIDENSRVITELKRAATAIGATPRIIATGGGADANFFNERGLPTSVISCGMAKVHTHNEEIKIDDLIGASEMILALITK